MIRKSGHRFSEKRSCSNKKIERDDDSKKSHLALGGLPSPSHCRNRSHLIPACGMHNGELEDAGRVIATGALPDKGVPDDQIPFRHSVGPDDFGSVSAAAAGT
jgi:hypothetical protein